MIKSNIISKIPDEKVKEYRNCFINGLMDSKFIVNETGLSDRTISSLLYNDSYKDNYYKKSLNKITRGYKKPFILPIKKKYTEPVKRVFNNYGINIEKKAKDILDNICNLTYNNQTASFIEDINNSNDKYLFIIENNISMYYGYLIPKGNYKIQLIVEENDEYFSKFIYDKNNGIKIKRINHHSNYWITEDGRIISLNSGKILSNQLTYKGYYSIRLASNGNDAIKTQYLIHRLVAEAFIYNLENKPQINHIDGIKTNNHYTNLEWCTNQENQIHAYNLGLNIIKYGEDVNNSKFTNDQVKQIRLDFFNNKYSIAELSRMYKVSTSTITFMLQYITYQNATDINEIPAYIPVKKEELYGENATRALFNNEQVKQIRLDFLNKLYSIKELAKIHNVSEHTIIQILQYKRYIDASDINEIPSIKYIIKSEMKGENSINASFTNDQVKQIRLDFFNNKYTINELSDLHNVSRDTIIRILEYKTYQDATDINEIPAYQYTLKINMEQAKQIRLDYINKKYSIRELAEIYNVSPGTIHKIILHKTHNEE